MLPLFKNPRLPVGMQLPATIKCPCQPERLPHPHLGQQILRQYAQLVVLLQVMHCRQRKRHTEALGIRVQLYSNVLPAAGMAVGVHLHGTCHLQQVR